MVDEQIRGRGIRDPRVLEAVLKVPRHEFLPPSLGCTAYDDRAQPIGHGQTISQPYIVAFMTEQLSVSAEHTVLEIGTGTGYQTAVLALLAKHVYTVERIAALQQQAAASLERLGLTNIAMSVADGTLGLASSAPFDRVIVTAAAPKVPAPLVTQLRDGGILIMPVGAREEQTIVRVERRGTRTVETPLLACRFVKLIGREGWTTDSGTS